MGEVEKETVPIQGLGLGGSKLGMTWIGLGPHLMTHGMGGIQLMLATEIAGIAKWCDHDIALYDRIAYQWKFCSQILLLIKD